MFYNWLCWEIPRPYLLFKIPVGKRKNFSLNYSKFGQAALKVFASPAQPSPRPKTCKEYRSEGRQIVILRGALTCLGPTLQHDVKRESLESESIS
jgi:hypothetical protein